MKTNVGVFFGGRSTEHEISVISANQAMHAFDETKYNVIPIYITKEGKMYTGPKLFDIQAYKNTAELISQCKEVFLKSQFGDFHLYTEKKSMFGRKLVAMDQLDIAMPVLHGANGEDGSFQGLLRMIGVPFVGCDVMASANGMDKISMKMLLRDAQIPVVDFVWFTEKNWHNSKNNIIDEIENKLGYPVIVKPSNLGSSVGIGKASNREDLELKIKGAQKFSDRIIVEKLIEQLQEINCSVLGNADSYKMSVLEEPLKTGDFLSYEDKYMGGSKGQKGMQASAKRIPAELPDDVTTKIQRLAGDTFRILDCNGVSRVDVIIDKSSSEVFVNEINTIPGSLSFYLWEATGLKFSQLLDELIKLALKRTHDIEKKTFSFDQNIFAMGGGIGLKGVKK